MIWDELANSFVTSDRRAVAELTWRAAKRVAPVIARAADEYGPDALEWMNAVGASLGVIERFVSNRPASRFTLDLAADVARSAATAGANAARVLGPSKVAEDAELAFAAAAFAADVCRAPNPQRASMFAVQGVRAADATGLFPRPLLEADLSHLSDRAFGPLWPYGEPDWSADGRRRLAAANLPALLGG